MVHREIARRVDRDVRALHSDVHALLKVGMLKRDDDGRVVFPYDAIHVDFLLRARDCARGNPGFSSCR